MIQIIPSISILNSKVTRVRAGNYDDETVYADDPVQVARELEDHGIKVVHLVDLDGAKRGAPVNYHILETMAGHTDLELDFTGGIHTDGDISKAFEYGAHYVTAASVAVEQKDLFASWIITYGREKITLGADAKNNKIAYRGWLQNTEIDIFEHIEYFYERGLKYVKTTDIEKEGSMEGPSFELYEEIIKRFPNICVLASGGVRNIEDIERLNDIGVFAVIFGKAYYEGNISLKDLDKFLVKA